MSVYEFVGVHVYVNVFVFVFVHAYVCTYVCACVWECVGGMDPLELGLQTAILMSAGTELSPLEEQ